LKEVQATAVGLIQQKYELEMHIYKIRKKYDPNFDLFDLRVT